MNRPGASIAALEQRSQLLRRLREFFYAREFVEVETPLLADEVIPELHIDLSRVATQHTAHQSESEDRLALRGNAATAFLQASPELHMKRLVAAGMQAIFQVTRSFRANERGALHHPEFTIVEWYRVGDDLHAGLQLLDELCQALLGSSAARRTTYAAAFEKYVGINPHSSTAEQLAQRAAELGIAIPAMTQTSDRDQWLNLLLAFKVEPELGRAGPEILYDYPASQAALAKTVARAGGIEVAERFELYCQGVELANGYHELTDAAELRNRLEVVNHNRQAESKAALPMPERLLAAMEAGLPACAGCALGFDRLVMLARGAHTIAEVSALVDDAGGDA
ncbi:MAG: EF-P lysine aminoacylase EpmA [Bythopirellula sp.]